jgi:hypothetical protein
MRRFHLISMVVWALLIIPTVVFWHDSILWIAFMSIYAIVVSHFAAWRADEPTRGGDD